ncbi:MAG: PAS domain S-box protein [Balneolaceae bacterium]|nr:MAG: PAS domain S-box protein [Balneolaceae bacterium]
MSEDSSSLIFENSPAVMFIIDPETRRFVDVNKAALGFYGWTREEFLQKKVEDINLLSADELEEKIDQVRQSGKSVFEFKHRLAGGEVRDVEIFSGTLRIYGKEMLHTVVQDITDRKTEESEFRRQTEIISQLMNATEEGMYGLDQNACCTFVNRSALKLLGYPDERALIGRNIHDLIHSGTGTTESHPLDECLIYKALMQGKAISGIHDFFRKQDGSLLPVECWAHPILDQGEIRGGAVTFVDISARKDREKRFNSILKQLSDYKYALDASSNVVITDRNGVILEVNDHTCELSGYSREELIGNNTAINRSGYHSDAFYEELWSSIKRGKVWRGDIKNRAKDGSEYWVDTTIIPFLGDDGRPERFMAIRFENTKEKEAENRIEQSERKFRAMIQNGTDFFGVIDKDYRYTYLSPSYEKMLGVAPESLLGSRGINFVHPDDIEGLAKVFTSIEENETRSGVTYRFSNHRYGWRWVESSITRKFTDPQVGGFVLNSRDVTDTFLYSRIDFLERSSLEQFLKGEKLERIYLEMIENMENLIPGARFILMNTEEEEPCIISASSNNDPQMGNGMNELALEAARMMKLAPAALPDRIELKDLKSQMGDEVPENLMILSVSDHATGYPVYDQDSDHLIYLLITSFRGKKMDQEWMDRFSARFSGLIRMIESNRKKDTKLREIKTRFELVQNATNDAIYDRDYKTGLLEWGEGIQISFGYNDRNRPWHISEWYDRIHPQDIDTVRHNLEKTIDDNSLSKWSYEYRFCRLDGSYAHVLENGFILREEKGRARRMIGAIRDITVRVKQQKVSELMAATGSIFNRHSSLQVSLQLTLQELLDKMALELSEVWLSDSEGSGLNKFAWAVRDGGISKIYDSTLNFDYIRTGEGLAGKVFKNGKPEKWVSGQEDSGYIRAQAAAEAGLKFAYAVPLVNAGKTIGVLLTASSKFSEEEIDLIFLGGDFVSYLAGEISRKQSENELNRIFESTPDILCMAGLDGYFKKLNPAASHLLGYSMEELMERPYKEFVHPEDISATADIEAVMKAGSHVAFFENRYITKEGKVIWLAWTSRVFPDDEVQIGIAKDITDRKQYEESLKEMNSELEELVRQLEKSNEELEQFAFIASHDLQEPLRMISSFISQLDKNYENLLDDRAKQYIHFIKEGSSRMRSIIMDLLEYSRIGHVNTEMTEVDLNPILTRLQGIFRKTIHDKKALIEVSQMPVIIASEQGMAQIFQNLLGNALKYNRKNVSPRIELVVEELDDFWKFCVKDNGIGIEKEYSDKIFTIFQRLHSREEYAGSGVGLAICKKIVDNHGGRIWVESEIGKGSTFCFTIFKNLTVSSPSSEE